MSQITLTVAEIVDLAKAAGIIADYKKHPVDDDEIEYTIFEAPEGVEIIDLDAPEGETHQRYVHGAYLTEYHEEGTYPLGNPMDIQTEMI